jgi:chromate transporter
LWLVPLGLLHAALGFTHVVAQLARMFSVLAVVTFGGAYAVLASLGQTVVDHAGWMTPQQMMDGFGLAETTPGPLILVGQFVAFQSAHAVSDQFSTALAGSLVFLWMTFVPCFLWIFAGAPWIDWLSGHARLQSALAAITAAVTGVILNLSVWFGLQVVFGRVERLSGPVPLWWADWLSPDLWAVALVAMLGLGHLKWHWGIPKLLALAAAAGLIWHIAHNGLV